MSYYYVHFTFCKTSGPGPKAHFGGLDASDLRHQTKTNQNRIVDANMKDLLLDCGEK